MTMTSYAAPGVSGRVKNDEKRRERELKRSIKRDGNRHRRRALKRQLDRDPESAHLAEPDFGRSSSALLNGQHRDRKRIRDEEE